ncbi:MAG: hypothetical protein AVDCRST_MAG51-2013, partial [uncultured Ramlibacter sp.]
EDLSSWQHARLRRRRTGAVDRHRVGATAAPDQGRRPRAHHRTAGHSREGDGRQPEDVLGEEQLHRVRAQGRPGDRRHHLQSGHGADAGAPPRTSGKGALPARALVRPRGPRRRAGQQGHGRAAGPRPGRRRHQHQVGPHPDGGSHRRLRQPDRPPVRRLPAQGHQIGRA